MDYHFEVSAFITKADGGKKTTTVKAKYRKPLNEWLNYDYSVLEKILAKKAGVGSNVVVMDVKEVPGQYYERARSCERV